MKTYITPLAILLYIIGISFFISGCKKSSPSPLSLITATCVSAVPDTVYVGQSVTFSSCTQGATSFFWNFGDGNTATTDTAIHSYDTAGNFIVSFTPSNAAGHGATKTFIIVVINAGYYTFKGTTYTIPTCTCTPDASLNFFGGALELLDLTGSGSTTGAIIQSSGGTYPAYCTGYCWGIAISYYYQPVPTNKTITITTIGNSTHGSVNMASTGIMLANKNLPSDSAPVTFSMTYVY